MKSKNFEYFLMVIILLMALISSLGCGGLKSENEWLKEENTDINAENDKLRREMNALKTENSKMHVRLAHLNLEISVLQIEILNLQKGLDEYKLKAKDLERKSRKH